MPALTDPSQGRTCGQPSSRLSAERGCRAVLEVIQALEQGRTLPETRDLDPGEAYRVGELRSVMAVYGDRCRP